MLTESTFLLIAFSEILTGINFHNFEHGNAKASRDGESAEDDQCVSTSSAIY